MEDRGRPAHPSQAAFLLGPMVEWEYTAFSKSAASAWEFESPSAHQVLG
jgi:hypothetical protein